MSGFASAECGTGIPPCGPGLEYEYDGENRLVRIRRDTNDAQGLPDGQGGQTPIAEQNVQVDYVYDAFDRRVEAVEYVAEYRGEAHILLSLGAARVDGCRANRLGSAENTQPNGWLHA